VSSAQQADHQPFDHLALSDDDVVDLAGEQFNECAFLGDLFSQGADVDRIVRFFHFSMLFFYVFSDTRNSQFKACFAVKSMLKIRGAKPCK